MSNPHKDVPARQTCDISLARIEEAAASINPVFRDTPQLVFDSLSRELGVDVVLKVETLNPIRSFKGRGQHAVPLQRALVPSRFPSSALDS